MKITKITTHVLRAPLGDKFFLSSQAFFPERTSCLVSIETDQGIAGWGEGGQYGPPEPVASCVDAVLAPRLIGRDPTEPVRLWEENYAFSRDFGQKGTYAEAISAIDIALWDIAGQAAGLPVWKMLGGGFRSSVTAYATGCYYPDYYDDLPRVMAELEAEAAGYADAGFTIVKAKIGLLHPRDDLERLRTVRAAIGPDIALLVDANHAYNAATAVTLSRKMEPLEIGWFEEPVVPEDRNGYRKVRQEGPIPVAGGEAEFTRFGFRDLIGGGCVDIVQPDLAASGGLSEWVKILALATTHGVAVVPHVWGSGIAVAAALQALATVPLSPHTANPIPLVNEPIVEFDRTHNPLRDDLLVTPFELVDGALAIPDGPGLGVEIDRKVLEKYSAG